MNQAADQYRIIAAGAGWIERRDRDRLRFDGRDAVTFLQALVTNDVQPLTAGRAVYTAYLTSQGRMVADLTICNGGEYLLADVPAGHGPRLAERFDRLIFTEDLRVSDVSEATRQLTIVGDGAASVLARACALEPHASEQLAALPALGHMRSGALVLARTRAVELPSFDVFMPVEQLEAIARRLGESGAVRMPAELLDALRIEAGHPAFGVDMTEETIPLEAGLLDRAISTTKGCYVGQEIIIRVLHRGGGRVARRLAKLAFDPEVRMPPPAGAPLLDDAHEVGRITSAAMSPTHGNVIALGYVRRDAAEPGRRLTARTESGDLPASIVGFAS